MTKNKLNSIGQKPLADDLLTPEEVAAYLSVPLGTIRGMVKRGELRFRGFRGQPLITLDELDTYLEKLCSTYRAS